MSRSLIEEISRGRRAITLARQRGLDTTVWEESLANLERRTLLAWAAQLAEQDVVLTSTVSYVEAPMRTITTERVSWYATHYLRTIAHARLQQQTGGWRPWTPEWWREREEEALGALAALRVALGERMRAEENRDE